MLLIIINDYIKSNYLFIIWADFPKNGFQLCWMGLFNIIDLYR